MSEYKLVPVEPTWEMTNAASENTDVNSFIDINNVYKAMLSASPKIESGQGLIVQSIQTNTVTIDHAEYEAMKADAERYRWLRAENANLEDDTFVVLGHDSSAEEKWQKYWVGSDLDQAIDQARKI